LKGGICGGIGPRGGLLGVGSPMNFCPSGDSPPAPFKC
jgi:hypothetical protein